MWKKQCEAKPWNRSNSHWLLACAAAFSPPARAKPLSPPRRKEAYRQAIGTNFGCPALHKAPLRGQSSAPLKGEELWPLRGAQCKKQMCRTPKTRTYCLSVRFLSPERWKLLPWKPDKYQEPLEITKNHSENHRIAWNYTESMWATKESHWNN